MGLFEKNKYSHFEFWLLYRFFLVFLRCLFQLRTIFRSISFTDRHYGWYVPVYFVFCLLITINMFDYNSNNNEKKNWRTNSNSIRVSMVNQLEREEKRIIVYIVLVYCKNRSTSNSNSFWLSISDGDYGHWRSINFMNQTIY